MSTNPYIGYASIAIANGASLSGGDAMAGSPPMAIQMPAAWTTANLTFQCSADGTTYADVYDKDGAEYTVTAAASRYY